MVTTDKDKIQALAKKLRNIGPVCAEKLLAIGIDSLEKLQDMGAETVFRTLIETGQLGPCCNAAYLYALEGAIIGCDWRDIPEAKKKAFKNFSAEMRTRYVRKSTR